MSFFAACVWSLARSLIVAAAGVMVATQLRRTVTGERGTSVPRWQRNLLWSLLLLPVFIPGLLVGYGYRNFSLSLVHHPLWNELAYAALILFMVVPVATLILVCAPPPAVSRSAVHVAMKGGRVAGWPSERRIGILCHLFTLPLYHSLRLRHHLFAVLPAFAVMFLMTFQETEVAALMQARGWPEWMFTRLAMGLSLAESLLKLLPLIGIQLCVIAVAVWVMRDSLRNRASAIERSPSVTTTHRAFGWTYLIVALAGLLIVPGGLVLRGTIDGFTVLGAHPALMSQIGISLLFGVTAGLLAWIGSGWVIRQLYRRRGMAAAVICVIPGLLGAWTLGVLLAELFRLPGLRLIYGTPLPLLLGEVLYQLPRAVLIRLLLGRLQSSSAAHSARLLMDAPDGGRRRRAADILWRLDTRGRVVGALIVCYWASMELTIPSPALLGPPGMTTAPVLLYNQMHYGQISGLSALVLAAITVPVVCLIGVSWAARAMALRPK